MRLQNKNISIGLVSKNSLYEFTKFVAEEYYKHNVPVWQTTIISEQEIKAMYREDINQYPYSYYYAAKVDNKIIGTIKVTKWNRKDTLPIQKLFGIDIKNNKNFAKCNIWHVGRFATSLNWGSQNISLFKQLMVYAITPICNDEAGIMVAECDCKLLRVMTALGIVTTSLGKSIEYLHSETKPIYAGKEGLMGFYLNQDKTMLPNQLNVIDLQF